MVPPPRNSTSPPNVILNTLTAVQQDIKALAVALASVHQNVKTLTEYLDASLRDTENDRNWMKNELAGLSRVHEVLLAHLMILEMGDDDSSEG